MEIGPSGPFLARTGPSKRHEVAARRLCQLSDEQLLTTHPGRL
ncbi:hypothetical protein [Streptomyces sp. NPDC047079]